MKKLNYFLTIAQKVQERSLTHPCVTNCNVDLSRDEGGRPMLAVTIVIGDSIRQFDFFSWVSDSKNGDTMAVRFVPIR